MTRVRRSVLSAGVLVARCGALHGNVQNPFPARTELTLLDRRDLRGPDPVCTYDTYAVACTRMWQRPMRNAKKRRRRRWSVERWSVLVDPCRGERAGSAHTPLSESTRSSRRWKGLSRMSATSLAETSGAKCMPLGIVPSRWIASSLRTAERGDRCDHFFAAATRETTGALSSLVAASRFLSAPLAVNLIGRPRWSY